MLRLKLKKQDDPSGSIIAPLQSISSELTTMNIPCFKRHWLLGLALATFAQPIFAESEKPNILMILIDDMGWKDLSYAGSTYYETPHIDSLASEGVVFHQAYSAAPTCKPSRGALFSGKNPARTKVTTVMGAIAQPTEKLFPVSKYQGKKDQTLEAGFRHVLPKKEIIFADVVSKAGYATGFFGKWHIGECDGYYPDQRGFDVAKGYRLRSLSTSKSGHWMKLFHKVGANMEGVDRDAYLAEALTQQCIDFIEEKKDKPWLAVLSHYLVHNPISPKPDKLQKYRKKPTTDQKNPGYAAMVESVDDSVGRVLQTLKKLNLEDNTLIIFTSDNGGLTPKVTSNYPLFGGKSFPFEAGVSVPLIFKWPAKFKPSTSDQRVINMDLYPTILSAAGLPLRPKQHVDGVDLMPVLTKKADLKTRPLVFHHPHYTHATGPYSTMIDGDWKLIRFYNDAQGAYMLFNISEDREERADLASSMPEVVARLDKKLARLLSEMQAEMPTPNPEFEVGTSKGKFNLKYTRDLADKERAYFKSLIDKK